MRYLLIGLCFVGLLSAQPTAMSQTVVIPDNPAQSSELNSLNGDVQSAKNEIKRLRIDEEKWKGRKRLLTALSVSIGGMLGILAWFSDSNAANAAKTIEPISARREKDETRIREILDAQSKLAIASANKAAGEANQKAEQEKLEREKLEAEISPRRLSREQESWLSQIPYRGRVVEIKSYIGDVEGLVLATQIADALKGNASLLDNRSTIQPVRSVVFGITVEGGDADLVAKLSVAFGDLVRSAQMPADDFNFSSSFGVHLSPVPTSAVITVGVKPIK